MDDIKYNPLEDNQIQDKSIFIATPCYGGNLTIEYTNSLLGFLMSCFRYKVDCSIELTGNESLITRGRNHLVSKFMASNCTHLAFVDADIEFNGEDLIKLLKHNLPIVCGAYTTKSLNEAYVVNLTDHEKIAHFPNSNVVEVLNSGTGFMMIERSVIEEMQKNYPELHYETDFDGSYMDLSKMPDEYIANLRKNLYSLFDTIHDTEDDNRYLSEDYTFCKRYKDIGGRIFLDTSILLNHVGRHKFKGDLEKLIKFNEN